MTIDDTGHHELAGSVDDLRIFRSFYRAAHLGDFSIPNQDRAALDGAVARGEDGGVLDQDHCRWFGGWRLRNASLARCRDAHQYDAEQQPWSDEFCGSHRAP